MYIYMNVTYRLSKCPKDRVSSDKVNTDILLSSVVEGKCRDVNIYIVRHVLCSMS